MNQELLQYVENARQIGIDDQVIVAKLKEVGWPEKIIVQTLNKHDTSLNSLRWASVPSLVFGYLWLLSGLNKVLTDQFVSGFGEFARGQLERDSVIGFFRTILSNVVAPHPVFFANLIQYGEVAIGLGLLLGSTWSYIKPSRTNQLILLFSFATSFLLVLNFILSLGLPLPLINTDNSFASGVDLDYIVLFISLLMVFAHFQAWREIRR